jgi:hypothetical protein
VPNYELPSLAELGISAPAGAELTFDDAGALTVSSDGDLYVEGRSIEIAGLTSLTLATSGAIVVSGSLVLPPGAVLILEAGGEIAIDGDIGDPGDGDDPPLVIDPLCSRLSPVYPPVERELGRFFLVASAAQQIAVDVRPRSRRNLVRLGRDRWIPVAILGSAEIDVREVDELSLRLGPGGASPMGLPGRLRIRPLDVNRDGYMDLVVLFDLRNAGIAFGDARLCLVAETRDGDVLEGCDAIDTRPWWARSVHRWGR